MIASELKYDIEIHNPTTTRGQTGAIQATFALYKSIRAGIKYMGGDESERFRQVKAGQKIRFKIRFDGDITEEMRVKYNNQFFNINYIEPFGRFIMFLHTEKI